MRWTNEKCNNYSTLVIYNCFTDCLKQSSKTGTDTKKKMNESVLQSTKWDANEHGLQLTSATMSIFLAQKRKKYVRQKRYFDKFVPGPKS